MFYRLEVQAQRIILAFEIAADRGQRGRQPYSGVASSMAVTQARGNGGSGLR